MSATLRHAGRCFEAARGIASRESVLSRANTDRPAKTPADRTTRSGESRKAARHSPLAPSNSSQPRPGNFRSADRRSRRFGSYASTLHPSTVSPTRQSLHSRRPRDMPTPPNNRSRSPAPATEIREVPARAAADAPNRCEGGGGGTLTTSVRESRLRCRVCRLRDGPREGLVERQWLDREPCSPSPIERRWSFVAPAINERPTVASPAVTSASHSPDNRGVSTGTGSRYRRSPRWRAYSFIMSPYDITSGPQSRISRRRRRRRSLPP